VDPIDFAVAQYAQAASSACVFELRCRFLADNAAMGDKFLSCGLTDLVDRLTTRFNASLSADDVALLTSCAVLRNRLLHLELSRHAGKLVSLGDQLSRGGVVMLDLSADDLPTFAEQLQNGNVTVGNPRTVSDTNMVTGRVYGWLAESAGSGAFWQSRARFHKAIDVIERLHAVLNAET